MKKKLLPVAVIVGFCFVAWLVIKNPPTVEKVQPPSKQITVDVMPLKKQNVQVVVDSFGTVKPRTQSILFPQVSGQIKAIGPSFREGRFFNKNEVLVQLDARDLKAEIKIAESALLSARQMLSEEEARVKQAQLDWQRLGNKEKAPDLVMRKPQLQAAMAKVLSAEAGLTKAKLALERTKIVAPFDGRVLSKSVDVGQVVTPSTELAKIYATDYVEIRLPIKNKDLPYLYLPESTRHEALKKDKQPQVTFYSDLVDRQSWQGRVIRTESAFDVNAQQLFVVAQIDDPYGVSHAGKLTLKIGQYLTAKIDGKILKDVLVVPNKALYQNTYVYLVVKGKVIKKNVDIAWQNDDISVIKSGIKAGDLLVTTSLGQVVSGTKAKILNKDNKVKPLPKSTKPRKTPQGDAS